MGRAFRSPAALGLLVVLLSGGCAPYLAPEKESAPALEIDEARLILDNDLAFSSKLDLVEGASQSLDLMYYIYSEDFSSSVFTKALIDAARRGVRVRLLLDYPTNYKHLDLFSMMEQRGKEGTGSLEVRLYNRPTRNVIEDAAYMTMGCGRENPDPPPGQCSQEKFARIEKLLAAEAAGGRNISNLNIGSSGLFLSGLYTKQSTAMALAVVEGQDLDLGKMTQGAGASPEDKEKLKQLGRIYWRSKAGTPFQAAQARFQLFLAFSLYGEQLGPINETFTRLLPAEKSFSDEAVLDWEHITDFLHHKLLLADSSRLQMGGRNIEDSYHLHPNELTEKYVFMDTDLRADFSRGGESIARTFEALWSFNSMVATLAEIRQHAPNDFVANIEAYQGAEEACKQVVEPAERETCLAQGFGARAKSLADRIAERESRMVENAEIYRTRYTPLPKSESELATFRIDDAAVFSYLENLPFDPSLPRERRRRLYGAENGQEARSGKSIHDAWVKELPKVCEAATASQPKVVVLHHAYFFPASNLVYALSRMIDGGIDCRHVTVKVLTNSIQTTDLSPVNLLARHWLKAFLELYDEQGDPARRARFEYYEYQPREGEGRLSLHTKLSLLGDQILIGSANADVRSYMMDSNNEMVLSNAPGLIREYTAYLDTLMNDPARVRPLTGSLRTARREDMVAEDKETLRQILARFGVNRHLDAGQIKQLEARFSQMLEDSYHLTKGSMSRQLAQRKQQQKAFNDRFKAI